MLSVIEGERMKNIDFQTLNDLIEKKRKAVNEQIAQERSSNARGTRTRKRSKGEREALDQISLRRWQKAVEKGKVKKLGTNTWYYDYTD
jgi:hypothetical protein